MEEGRGGWLAGELGLLSVCLFVSISMDVGFVMEESKHVINENMDVFEGLLTNYMEPQVMEGIQVWKSKVSSTIELPVLPHVHYTRVHTRQ